MSANDVKKRVSTFIDYIFKDLTPDENVLFWGSANKIPGFPSKKEKFFNRVLRGKSKKACYFSTSTTVPDEKDGQVYNRQKLFSRLFCIVLDDIGTGEGSKCTVDELPKMLREEYSWRLETSPDNYQYGFVLDTPIDNLYHAVDFVKIIYGAGAWDSGGALPNKLVRLPCGVNLKDKYASDDGLFELDPKHNDLFDGDSFNTFTVEELLDAVNAGITWSDIEAGNAGKLDPRKTRGATSWREGVYHSSLTGVVDDALEWLNDNNLVVNEGPEWVDIICPWHPEHTDGNNTAGYKPLGVGDKPERRLFHCFHGHCATRRTDEFLTWLNDSGGPLLGTVDPVPGLVAEWAFDEFANSFVSLKNTDIVIPNAGFKTGHQNDVWWIGLNGKSARASEYSLILKNKGLLKLHGSRYDPGANSILEVGKYKKLNSWSIPQWPIMVRDTSQDHWTIFKDFIKYVLPNNGDTEWFLNHLAAKAQDAKYRGPCVVLTTPAQGTGRGTIQNMLSQLWGSKNTVGINLNELLKGLGGDGFNDWLLSVWTVVPEARDAKLSRTEESKSYESLKTGIDPAVTNHLIRAKYGSQGNSDVYCSYIICSNHADVLSIPPTDRRFLTFECTSRPGSVKFFDKINAWLKTDWCSSVWYELINRDISKHSGFAPKNAQLDDASPIDNLILALPGQSPLDRIVSAALIFAERECRGALHTSTICTWVAEYQMQLGVCNIKNWEPVLKRLIQGATAEIRVNGKRRSYKRDNKKCFARSVLSPVGYDLIDDIDNNDAFDQVKDLVHGQSSEFFRDFVLEIFNEAGV